MNHHTREAAQRSEACNGPILYGHFIQEDFLLINKEISRSTILPQHLLLVRCGIKAK